jgi:hypothetical protein
MNGIDPKHVETKRGMSYIAQHQARAEMTRIFGVGNWDSRVESMDLLYETQIEQGQPQYPAKGDGKPYYVACYKAAVTVNVRDYFGFPVASFTEYHVEENAPLPNRGEAHAMAVTSVESYALRRALIGLGDRLGLGLYEKGQVTPLVRGTLQLTDPESPLFQEPHTKGEDKGNPEKDPEEDPKSEGPAEPVGAKHQGAFKTNGEQANG